MGVSVFVTMKTAGQLMNVAFILKNGVKAETLLVK